MKELDQLEAIICKDAGKLEDSLADMFEYKMQTSEGNSSPIFREKDGKCEVVGIHTGGILNSKKYGGGPINYGVRLTTRVRDIIGSWIGPTGSLCLNQEALQDN